MLQPILDEINRRQQQETGQAQADKAAQVAAMTKAYQDQVAPLTQTYDTSVNQATQLNQGVADRLAASSGQDAAAYQKQLEAIGAPNAAQAGQQATQAGQAAGSVSYASGANDVSNLIAAKTADLAFLQKQPGVAAQQAEHDLASQLQEIVSKYQDQAGDVRSQIPQEVQSMFESAYGRKADASKSAFDAAAQSADNTYQDALNAWKAGNDQKQYTYEQKMAQRKELDDIAAQHEKNLYDLQQEREKGKLALIINAQNAKTKFNADAYNRQTKLLTQQLNNQYKQQNQQWMIEHGFTPTGSNLPQPKTTKSTGPPSQKYITGPDGNPVPNPNYVPPSKKKPASGAADNRVRENQAVNEINSQLFNPKTKQPRVNAPTGLGDLNGIINTTLRAHKVDPFGKQGTSIRKAALYKMGWRQRPNGQWWFP